MSYVKIKDDEIEVYPYSIHRIRKDNPNTAFPTTLTDELLAHWNIFPVSIVDVPEYDANTQYVKTSATPVLIDDVWTLQQEVVDKSDEQIQAESVNKSKSVRQGRDRLLSECDWVITKSLELGEPVPDAWATYRQALRDIPTQEGFPIDFDWPTKPN